MHSARERRPRILLVAGTLLALGGWIGLRATVERPPSGSTASLAPAATMRTAPVTDSLPHVSGVPVVLPEAGPAASALLADAATTRAQGDLRATLQLLRAAVERAPAVETHAALGGLYLELGAAAAADPHLRAAAEGDPRTAERWIALANALALKPDPLAAAAALEHARSAEPGIRVTRDDRGWLTRDVTPPAP